MKYVKLFEQFLTESISKKDWDRMSDLIISGKDGSGTVRTIKDKKKAIARFIAGLKLNRDEINYRERSGYSGEFSEFGNKALELGATPEEIQKAYDEATVPEEIIQKISDKRNKQYGNMFIGDIVKAIEKAGYNVNFPNPKGYANGGRAITQAGEWAMEDNGRKWTIGYHFQIDNGDKTINLKFDAITDEAGGSTIYVFADDDHEKIGKRTFISKMLSMLSDELKN